MIFGCSEKILEIEKQLPQLLENNTSIGLNSFPLYYKTDYWLWLDNPKFGNNVFTRNGKGYKPCIIFEPNADLLGFALDFAITSGYKKAILFGILDGEYTVIDEQSVSYRHFYDQIDKTTPLVRIEAFKATINNYKNKIEIEIPLVGG